MRITLSILVLVLFSMAVSAQVRLGLRASYGFSDLQTNTELDDVEDQFDNASSLSFGVMAEFPFGDVFSLRSGVEINRRGTTFGLGEGGSVFGSTVFGATVPFGAEAKTRFTYIDIPVLAQVNIPLGNTIEPYIFAGPAFGLATTGNVRTTSTALASVSLMTADIDLDDIGYERFHVAATAGVGVRVKLGERLITFVEGRYEQSLTEPYEVPLQQEVRTGFQGVQFGAGFAFSL